MKRSDSYFVGLSFYIVTLVALELVARDRRPWWWGWLLVAGWIACLVVVVAGREGGK